MNHQRLPPQILEFIEFVNRLPITEEQKIEFVKHQIAVVEKKIEEKKKNKELFKNVLEDLVEL